MGAYTKLTYHVVFGTKYRRPLIREEFQERLYEYIGGTIRELDGHLIEIGGIELNSNRNGCSKPSTTDDCWRRFAAHAGRGGDPRSMS